MQRKRTSWAFNTPAEIKSGERSPDDLCGGRRLGGSEFQRRKAELERLYREKPELGRATYPRRSNWGVAL